MYIYIYIYIYIHILQITDKPFFLAPTIPPVSDKNEENEKLSSANHFPSKRLQERTSLCPHEKCPICITIGIKTYKGNSQ